MNARCWFVSGLLGLLLLVPSLAVAQRGSETVLLLSVLRGGKVDAKLTHALYDHLAKAGERLTRENALMGPERLCGNEECMTQLASREGAKVVLGVQIQDTGPSNQYVTMMLFDADQHATSEERTICSKCNAQQLGTALDDLGNRVLRSYREKKASQASVTDSAQLPSGGTLPSSALTGPPGTVLPPPTPTEPPTGTAPVGNGDYFSRWSKNRKIAAGVLTGLFFAALIPTVALHATDGSETSVIGCANPAQFCVLQNKPLYTAGYAISGALAVGLAITLAWPTAKPTSPTQSASVETESK